MIKAKKIAHRAPIDFVTLQNIQPEKKINHQKLDRILVVKVLLDFDTNNSALIQICVSLVKLDLVKSDLKFATAGELTNSLRWTQSITFKLPELNPSRKIFTLFKF